MKLFKHQQEAIDFTIKLNGKAALFHDMGLGKTRTALEVFKKLKYPKLKLLVVCPLSLIEGAWGEDIKKWTVFTYCNLRGKFKEADIYICNYEWFLRNKPDYSKNDWMIVLDESSKLKNHKSKITKHLLEVRNKFIYRIVMSGTPAPNTEEEYWGQIMFINDNLLPNNFFAFRHSYFYLTRGRQSIEVKGLDKLSLSSFLKKGFKYTLIPKYKQLFLNKIKTISHYAKKEECLDLPEVINQYRKVYMTNEQLKAYREMKENCITYIKSLEVIAPVILTKLMKLRQITSGFAYAEEGNTVAFEQNPKLNELIDTLAEIGNKQVIIWGNFKQEIYQIVNLFGRDKCAVMMGDIKDKDQEIIDFKTGVKQYLIANPKSAAHGLTLTNCSYQIFYSLDYSYEYYIQAKGRTHRAGQTNKCTYIHLIMDRSIDEIILDVLNNKHTLNEFIRRFMKDE